MGARHGTATDGPERERMEARDDAAGTRHCYIRWARPSREQLQAAELAFQAGGGPRAKVSRVGGEGGGPAVTPVCARTGRQPAKKSCMGGKAGPRRGRGAGAQEGSQRRKPSEVVSMRVPCGRMVGTSMTMFSALPSS